MLAQDYAIGDYLKNTTSESQFTYIDRELLVSILQDLNRKKEYKPETLHLAGSIADRYLKKVLEIGEPVPNLFALGATVTLLAAKLEQPISPSFNRMLALLPSEEQRRISKKHLIDLEEQILNALQFSLHFAGPMPFLERYQRLLGIDGEKGDHDLKQVGFTARQFCKYMQRFAQFLEYKPSQIAAAAIVLAMRLNVSPVGPSVGLKALRGDEVKQLVAKSASSNACASEEGRVLSPNRCKKFIGTLPTDDHLRIGSPLSLWNQNVA